MEQVDYLVIGAGMSGLGFANWIRAEAAARGRPAPTVKVCEATDQPGGYCKTVVQDGFVWDYSGHFFHFKHADLEAWLRARMAGEVRTVRKLSTIRVAGVDVDFPFQKNIHQLPKAQFLECLVDLYFKDEAAVAATPGSFKEMLYRRFGKGIAEQFLIPYNTKLYATDLDHLDRDAMGRFFPHADVADIIRNMRAADNASYNATFTYPARGAMEYVRALLRDLPADAVALATPVEHVDLRRRVARTPAGEVGYGRLVSSAPLPALLRLCGLPVPADTFSGNRVLVWNLGFDRKGRTDVHWMYFPDPARSFYRVGWYDNILDGERMSLYVEVGLPDDGAPIDPLAYRARILDDLRAEGVVTDHQLVASHTVTMAPAYAHITQRSIAAVADARRTLEAAGVYSVGRYGGWTYCSIEDNLLETRALAAALGPLL
ncbi:MAG: NAD(P)-binding protein [Kofleriaceae bacterium]